MVEDEIWEAPADGSEVKKGDKWLHVTSVDGVNLTDRGWMAYIHKGVAVCNNFKVTENPAASARASVPRIFHPHRPQRREGRICLRKDH